MLEKQFEELKLTGNLPSPTGVGLLILQRTQSEDASLDDVVDVLQADPTLTGRILKLANSADATGYERAATAHEAAVRLGLRTVRNVSLSFSLLSGNRTGRCKAFEYEEYWSHSLAVAVSAQVIAGLRSGTRPSEAFTCGLLSGIGRLALASIHPQAYEGVLERARGKSSRHLAELEQESFGTHHRELAAAMLRDWKLPDSFADVVGLVGSGASISEIRDPLARPLAATIQDARDLARSMTLPGDASASTCRERLADLERMRTRLGLDWHGLEELWSLACESWRTWGDLMRVRAQAALGLSELRARSEAPEAPAAGAGPDSSTPASPQEAEEEVALLGLNVLIVGPDAGAVGGLAQGLAADGHTVHTATGGYEGLTRALELAPHVLVTDLVLGGRDGLELVRTLRASELGKRMQCILLTEQGNEQRVLEAFESGVDEFLNKPFDPRILRARVRAALRVVRLREKVESLLRERENQVGQLAVLNRKLQVIAVTDMLTGLFNRRYAMQRLQQEVDNALSGARSLSVVMIDVDKFKRVNDEYGHDTGDAVLREVAKLLRGGVRRIDSACRVGGEEFLIICPGADDSAAQMIAERLRSAAAEKVIEYGGFSRTVTLSLGVATLDPSEPDIDLLIKRADRRVYLAKERGRNRVVARDPAADQRLAG